VRSVDNLVDLYFSSVGRNGKLLLNVPPTREGLLMETDVARLGSFRERLNSLFGHDLALMRVAHGCRPAGGQPSSALISGARLRSASARLAEDIAHGQSVARYTLYGGADDDWQVLSHGSTIGYAKLDRFAPVTVRRVRLAIEDAMATPQDRVIRLQLF
jgi:alpha-L-fucosidase